jgi:type I restriction enzyme, R subunit
MTTPEQRTRKLNDASLIDAGWEPIIPHNNTPFTHYALAAIEEYPTASGPSDYLIVHDHQPLAPVEAKKEGTGAQNVLGQAQRYSEGIADSPFDFNGYCTPFAYSSNGNQIWFRDLRDPSSRSREVKRFHTPAALREMLARAPQSALNWLSTVPPNYERLRPY